MWDILWYILAVLYIPASIGLIIIVLLQKGKGTGFAGAFGIGPGSETVFGPQTAQGTPVKITYIMAAMFMTIALLMSIISGRVGAGMAPELVDETAISETTSGTGLEEFGLGTGVTGQIDSSAIQVDAPAETAPATEEPAPVEATEAPAAESAPAEALEPAGTAPAERAPVAAEEAPASTEPAPSDTAPATSEAPVETPEAPAEPAPADSAPAAQ